MTQTPPYRVLCRMMAVLALLFVFVFGHAVQWAYHTHDTGVISNVLEAFAWALALTALAWCALAYAKLHFAMKAKRSECLDLHASCTDLRATIRAMRWREKRLKAMASTDKQLTKALQRCEADFQNEWQN